MTTITLSSDITVKLIDSMASDLSVTRAAQVSVKGENKPETSTPGLINYLMEARHGSPFEHNAMTFFVEAPLFVFREWQRHRVSSYNEMSGRYTKLLPKMYSPDRDRKLVNIGSSARPEFARGTAPQWGMVRLGDRRIAQAAWDEYEARIDAGVANEVARSILPLSIYSQMYWTVNARSLMNFLSLRVDSPDSRVRSRPQREIEMGAEKVEEIFASLMPITHEAFVRHGRVAP